MKSIFKYLTLAGLFFSAACEPTTVQPDVPDPDPKPEPEQVYIDLIADRETITADGVDAVHFTVTLNSEECTSEAMIINLADNSTIEGGVFTTTEAGSYTFVAAVGTNSSEPKTIVAVAPVIKEPVVELTADKLSIMADGEETVTFTVTADGEDVTAESEITFKIDGNALEGNTFSTNVYGNFDFVAIYDGYYSNTLTIKVSQINEPTPPPTPPVVGEFAVGDIYEVDGVKGVIFGFKDKTSGGETKTYAYVMSMDQATLAWSTENVWCNCLSIYGDWNTEDMLRNGSSPDKYPAAQWCVAHGDGWFMPSSTEMHLMWDAVSGGTHEFNEQSVSIFNEKLDDPIEEDFYWSSNETLDDMGEVVAFMESSVVCLEPMKWKEYNVRAVYKFEVQK